MCILIQSQLEQKRLANRGAAEMVLETISNSAGILSQTLMSTLNLGIAILTGGNQLVQSVSSSTFGQPSKLIHFIQ